MDGSGNGNTSKLGRHFSSGSFDLQTTFSANLLRIHKRACQAPEEWNLKPIQRVRCDFMSESVPIIWGVMSSTILIGVKRQQTDQSKIHDKYNP